MFRWSFPRIGNVKVLVTTFHHWNLMSVLSPVSCPAMVCESGYFASTSKKFQSFKVNVGSGICLLFLINSLISLRHVAEARLSRLNCFAENCFVHQVEPRLYFSRWLMP